ncbi:hypothetical protein SAV31267_088330 [Streptomyces avermitilis]|uniref:Uncharacterized protein n=1 Tax=Streptomyces avermitilis TaxID=33903 RepID=A0A4D4N497_STRAX|nr:hypothetical protein SAV31267_088330 [Streptomyces avermitilis]
MGWVVGEGLGVLVELVEDGVGVGEWKAWLVGRVLVLMPCCWQRVVMCWTVWGVPLMTREVGVLMAAMARSFSWAVRWWVMWWGVVWRVVMVPGAWFA